MDQRLMASQTDNKETSCSLVRGRDATSRTRNELKPTSDDDRERERAMRGRQNEVVWLLAASRRIQQLATSVSGGLYETTQASISRPIVSWLSNVADMSEGALYWRRRLVWMWILMRALTPQPSSAAAALCSGSAQVHSLSPPLPPPARSQSGLLAVKNCLAQYSPYRTADNVTGL